MVVVLTHKEKIRRSNKRIKGQQQQSWIGGEKSVRK